VSARQPPPFALAFREHVLPKLQREIEIEAFLLALDFTEYHSAYWNVFRVAQRYGALKLPDWVSDQLHDWLAETLLNATLAAERLIQERRNGS